MTALSSTAHSSSSSSSSSSSPPPPYKVFLVSYLGLPRSHHGIFIETGEGLHPRSGHLYQVTGDIQHGMRHDHRREDPPPEETPTFGGMKRLIGTVESGGEEYERVRRVVDGVEAPEKQFEGPRRLRPERELRRCQEWTREALRELVRRGVVVVEGGEERLEELLRPE